MKRWLLRGLGVGVILAVAGFLVAASGLVSIKASSGHWQITEWFLKFSMNRSIATHSLGIVEPDNLADPDLVLKGANAYEIGCRSCHGEPGMPQPRLATHMLPPPPELTLRIKESRPRELFYVVKHGVKLSGMPAWPSQHRDDEVWAMVAFLLKYPDLNHHDYRSLVHRPYSEKQDSGRPEADRPALAAVQACVSCHGKDGLGFGSEAFPKLAGQSAAYLHHALQAYARGDRHSGIMEPVAAALPRESLKPIADYYAGLAREAVEDNEKTENILGPTPAAVRGRAIAHEGIRERRVPACIECHEPRGRRSRPEYPLLTGQPAGYLELQLRLFRENRRGGSTYAHVMKPIASRLTPEQASDVAQYFASVSHRVGTGARR